MRAFLAMVGIALAAALPVLAQEHPHTDELGTVTFPVSCNAEAQTRMNRAVAMLHSFWFPRSAQDDSSRSSRRIPAAASRIGVSR